MRINRLRIAMMFFAIILVGCKNEKTSNSEVNPQREEIYDGLTVALEVIVKKDDNLQIYYIDNEKEAFTEEKSIWSEVKGSESSQKVIFKVPTSEAPHLLRLDFGLNSNQDDIVFSSIALNYFGKKRIIKGSEIAVFFRPLETTKVDFNTGVINAKDNTGKRIEPVLYPQEIPLGQELDKLIKEGK